MMLAIANHFEPEMVPGMPREHAEPDEQQRRVEAWCSAYAGLADRWRDVDGAPLRHTYFYPAERYEKLPLDLLAAHCRAGWGEIEVHLHHGVSTPDTSENTRMVLIGFRDTLASHGCLSYLDGEGSPRYAFVHGNWALANSGGGRFCGVDDEMQILAETGCFADLTLPSAPDVAQTAKINSIYECGAPLTSRAPHRTGRDLRVGRPPTRFPLIVQGPLGVGFEGIMSRGFPQIENGELTAANPPTLRRLALWRKAAISVVDRPDWLFVKLHCHGMSRQDTGALLGLPMQRFLSDLTEEARSGGAPYRIHFVTAREMTNIILAACDGREGDPGEYRDYRFRMRATR
ncbi:MAG TPA: hypothetical protein VMT45_08890 [Thermoanaerobaculaceae bacterium]|nr:hypothetical protein [Thermoanaerobaculaceae bacterium]